MPVREWRLFVADIIDAVEAIGQFTHGLTPEQFFSDRLRLDAVSRTSPSLGRRQGECPMTSCEVIPKSPGRRCAMRNIVVHEYFGIDRDVLWGTIGDDLAPLLVALRPLLEEPGRES